MSYITLYYVNALGTPFFCVKKRIKKKRMIDIELYKMESPYLHVHNCIKIRKVTLVLSGSPPIISKLFKS